MPMVAKPLRALPEPRKLDHRLWAVRAKKNKMASDGGARYGCATIGKSQPSQELRADQQNLKTNSCS
jgi:hypothetical protein